MRLVSLIILSFSASLSALAAQASDHATAKHLSVALVADRAGVRPGETFHAGIHFELEKNWHVYWLNAGDSGEPPRLAWKLPAGARAGPIEWPVPYRIPVGPLVNFGYESRVLLPVAIGVDETYASRRLALDVEVRWLVCREECVPGKARLTRELPVGQSAPDPRWSPVFARVAAERPTAPPAALRASVSASPAGLTLQFEQLPASARAAQFFPAIGDQLNSAGTVETKVESGRLRLPFQRSDRLLTDPASLAGLLIVVSGEGHAPIGAWLIDVPLSRAGLLELLLAAVAAFGGGLLLNLMPCVFPVLSIKVISLLQLSGHERTRARALSWAYAAGVVASFWVLVGALLALRAGGARLGWGFQLQSPVFVFLLAAVFFGLGLNLLGAFEVGGAFTGAGGSLAAREGVVGSFFTGALATLVATPCTAPFMGSAVGYALTQPALAALAVFTALAAGLAAPFVLVAHAPGLARLLPRPGAWMDTLKQALAFPIFGAVVWLAWVLGFESGPTGPVIIMTVCAGLGLAVWCARRFRAPVFGLALAVITIAGGALQLASVAPAPEPASSKNALRWEPFTPEKLAEHRARGEPVFLDFTAAWCVSCQVNELLVFRSETVKKKLKDLGFVLMKADWTNQDAEITRLLASFGRDGVPFYVIYGRGAAAPARPLPEVITPGIVLAALSEISGENKK